MPVQQAITACSARPSATSRAAASDAQAQSSRSESLSAPWGSPRGRAGRARSAISGGDPGHLVGGDGDAHAAIIADRTSPAAALRLVVDLGPGEAEDAVAQRPRGRLGAPRRPAAARRSSARPRRRARRSAARRARACPAGSGRSARSARGWGARSRSQRRTKSRFEAGSRSGRAGGGGRRGRRGGRGSRGRPSPRAAWSDGQGRAAS